MAKKLKVPFADEPSLHLKETASSKRCARCKEAIVSTTRWTMDKMYWDFAIYNCEKRKKK